MAKKVLIFGTFDLLHEGHKFFLKEAEKYGKVTIMVAPGETVYKFKKRHPIYSQSQRIEALRSLGYEALAESPDPWQDVLKEKPDIIVLGYDQNWEEQVKRKAKSEKLKIKVVRINRAHLPHVHNTTAIRKKLRV